MVHAVWLDGSLESAVAAAWVARCGRPWVAICEDRGRRGQLARALAERFGVPVVSLESALPAHDAAGLVIAARTASQAGAGALVLPLAARHEAPAGPALASRLAALEQALSTWQGPVLWAPLLRRTWPDLGRLAVALGVGPGESWDCAGDDGCGECEGCRGQRRAWKAVGL